MAIVARFASSFPGSGLRLRPVFSLCFTLLLCTPLGWAVDLTVECVDPSGNPVKASADITLTGGRGSVRTLHSNFGQPIEFLELEPGHYEVEVRGDYGAAVLDSVDIDGRGLVRTLVVHLPDTRRKARTASATVSASQLRVSPRAQKEVARGEALLRRGELDGARAHFVSALAADPNAAAAHNDLALAALGKGDRAQARVEFERAFELDPQNPVVSANLARLAYRDSDWQAVERFVPRSLAGRPDDARALAWLAEAEFHLGKCEEAVSAAVRLHALPHDEFAGIHILAARCAYLGGDGSSAQRELQHFLEEEPRSPLAADILLQIEELDDTGTGGSARR